MRSHTVPLDDLTLHYEEHGSGPPLVLLHGFGGCSRNWDPFAARLAERHRLIVVDLRGHGHSTNPDGTFTHRQAAADLLRLLDELGIERFSAMGMSTGAMTLLHMATSQPRRIDSMVLVSATTHFPDQARAIMRRASLDTVPADVAQMYRACATRGDEQVRQLLAQFNALHANVDDMNFTPRDLSAISARTLVVHGDRDNFFPVEIAVGLYRAIPDSALWIVPGGGHVPIFDTAPSFAETASGFVAGADGGIPASARP